MTQMIGTVALAVLAAAGLGFGWLLYRRPLAVFAWGTRRALAKAGLARRTVPAPAGPQTVFTGGTGPVLVLLHGAGDQAGTWHGVVKDLATRYTLVVPDLAGHGESAPATGPIETSAVFGALEAVVASLAAGRRVTFVGNSLGAWMAMVYAVRHPEQVDRVVAVNGGPLLGSPGSVRMLPTTREEARRTMAQLRDPGSPAIPDHVLDDMVRQAATGPLARFGGTAATMVPWLLGEAQLQGVGIPVRLVWGTADQLMPLDYARRMLAALPDARLIPIDGCGHIPQQEAPGRFRSALLEALGDAPGPEGGAP